jgi:hypothetical protein
MLRASATGAGGYLEWEIADRPPLKVSKPPGR